MRVFHTTDAAEAILSDGFRDGEGTYMTGQFWRGVWVADRPVDSSEGAAGDTVITLEIPEEIFIQYEWVEEGSEKSYRESLISAELLNGYGNLRLCTEEELDIEFEKWMDRNREILLAAGVEGSK